MSALDSDHPPQQSSSPDDTQLRTPADRTSAPPLFYGGLLACPLSVSELVTDIQASSVRLDNLFGNPHRPPPVEGFRSIWINLWRIAYPQKKNNFSDVFLSFDTHDEAMLTTIQVHEGPKYNDIDFNKLLQKSMEDARFIRAARNVAQQSVGAPQAGPSATMLDATQFLERYHISHEEPMLPELPGMQPSVVSSASSTGSTSNGIKRPDAATRLQRQHLRNQEDFTELMLEVIEIKVEDEARIGSAQAMCYLIASHAACGTWMATLCAGRSFVRFVMINDDTIGMESNDSGLLGKTYPVWTVFDKHCDDFMRVVIHPIGSPDGRQTLAETLQAMRDLGSAIRTDRPLSRLPFPTDLPLWADVGSRSVAIPIASQTPYLYIAEEARPRSISRVYAHLRQCMMTRAAPADSGPSGSQPRQRDSSDEEPKHGGRRKRERRVDMEGGRGTNGTGRGRTGAKSYGTTDRKRNSSSGEVPFELSVEDQDESKSKPMSFDFQS